MKASNLLLLFSLLIPSNLIAQNTYHFSVNDQKIPFKIQEEMAKLLFDINFNKSHRKELSKNDINLEFSTNSTGSSELIQITGIKSNSIRDSINAAINKFPKLELNSKSSIYIKYPRATFPKVSSYSALNNPIEEKKLQKEDFHFIHPSNVDFFGIFNVSKDFYSETISNHLNQTIALNFGLGLAFKNNFNIGLLTNLSFNKLKSAYNIESKNEFLNNPTLTGGAIFISKNIKDLNIRLEAGGFSQDITESKVYDDPNAVYLDAFTPAISFSYPIYKSKTKYKAEYPWVTVNTWKVSPRIGVKKVYYSNNIAQNGLIYQVGLDFQFDTNYSRDFKLKRKSTILKN